MVNYSYNVWNQLTQYLDGAGVATDYAYNGAGERVSKTQNGVTTQFYWDRGYISGEAQAEAFTAQNYVGAQGIFARNSGGSTDYLFKNGHGDVTALVRNGQIVKNYQYDAYGVEKNIDPEDTNPLGRPFAENPKSNKFSIRLDDETLAMLNEYCTENGVKRAEAIRQGIMMLLGKSDK